MLDTIDYVLASPWFQTGVILSVPILIVGMALRLCGRSNPLMPLGGLAFALAGSVGLVARPVIDATFLFSLLVFTATGLIGDLVRLNVLTQIVLACPGAWLVSQSLAGHPPQWVEFLVLAVLAIGSPLLALFDRTRTKPALGPLFFATSVGAAFLTLPNTNEILLLTPIAGVVGLTGWPVGTLRLGNAGVYACLALFAGVATWDSRGRVAAVIGAFATLSVPILTSLLVPGVRRGGGPHALLLGAAHLTVSLVAARVVGLRHSVSEAAALAVATLGAAAFVVWAIHARPIPEKDFA